MASPDLAAKLKNADPQIKRYVAELKKENARLQAQIARYETKQMSLDHRIKALERERKQRAGQTHLEILRRIEKV